MSNTYTQFHMQFVFATKFRTALIMPSWEEELYRYITGIVQKNDHKMLCINGMPDHLHILIGFGTTQSVESLLRDIKAGSSKWINERRFCESRFEWQSGYGGFSYGRSQIGRVISYIKNQKQHHQKTKFIDEYRLFLQKFEIEYDEKYIFKEPV